MAEHEFERFLEVLSKLLKLSSRETAAVADEICDHLEERYSELVRIGISREDAVRQALDEFEDAGEFAAKLNQLVRQRTRRRIMTGAFTTAAASALAILVTTAFWPDQRQGNRPAVAAVAQEGGTKPDETGSDEVIISIDHARYLPESLRRPVEIDLHDVELGAVAKFLQEQAGLPVILDQTELTNAGVGPDQRITIKTFQLPLYLVMDRMLEDVGGTELAWRLDDDVLSITTREKADTIQEAQTVDVSELLDDGFTMQDIIHVLQQHTSGPWQDVDGDGGRLIPLGTRLTFVQTQRGRFEVLSLLEGLRTPGRRILVDQPAGHRRIRQGLSAQVTSDFQGALFTDVLGEFASQADIPIVMDATELTNAGVGPDQQVSLSLPKGSLQRALRILLQDVGGTELAAVPANGVLAITTREKADTIQNVEIFDVSDLVTQDDMVQAVQLMESGTFGPWNNIDGEGGSITPVPKQRVIVRQTRAGLDSIDRLLNDHRKTKRARPPRPEPDPNQVELRYYRMTDKLAGELQDIIPRLVAVDSWAKLPDGSTPLIEKISVGVQPAGGLGAVGGGLGGGGFFQIGGGGMGGGGLGGHGGGAAGGAAAATDQPEKAETSSVSATAILAIRQTRRVHKEIDRFLRDLAEKAWPNSYINYGSPMGFGGGFGGGGLGGMGGSAL